MLINFYVCDSQNCKAFNCASQKGATGSKEYTLALLGELYNDGIWPLPYIGAAILTPLSLWFIGVPITVLTFAKVFLVSFIVIYFLFSFFGHHYIKFISLYVSNYIQSNCPSSQGETLNEGSDEYKNSPIYNEEESTCSQIENNTNVNISGPPTSENISGKSGFKSYTEGMDVTFATPVKIF